MNNINDLLLFSNELSWIKDSKLKDFTIKLLSEADDYFFTTPASTTGKYHPTFDLGEGGLVRHSKCVAFFAKCVAEAWDMNEHDTDLVIIAGLVHDIKKLGNNGSKWTVREHPILGGMYVQEQQKKHPELISENDANIIANAIVSHMGKWEHNAEFTKGKNPYPMPQTDIEKAVELGDYIASRKEILSFDFKDGQNTQDVAPQQTPVPEDVAKPTNPNNIVYPFGKKRGMTLKAICDEDPDYLEWVVNKSDFSDKELQSACKQVLEESKKKVKNV